MVWFSFFCRISLEFERLPPAHLLVRCPDKKEVEFMTIIQFDSLEAVKKFAGEDYEHAYVPAAAKKILKRYDDSLQNVMFN